MDIGEGQGPEPTPAEVHGTAKEQALSSGYRDLQAEIDLGKVLFASNRDVLVRKDGDFHPLLCLPSLPSDIDFDAHDLSEDVGDLFKACSILELNNRVFMDGNLLFSPPKNLEGNILCTLHVEINVYLRPAIF